MSDVLQVLVPKLNSGDGKTGELAAASISLLLQRGTHGDIMVDAVQLIADMVRQRKCVCKPAAVRCLLQLQFQDLTREDVQAGACSFAVVSSTW